MHKMQNLKGEGVRESGRWGKEKIKLYKWYDENGWIFRIKYV